MPRVVRIRKFGKSTHVNIVEQSSDKIYVCNKPTDISTVDNVMIVSIHGFSLFIQFEEIEDKLSATNINEYLEAASTALLFSNN